MRPGRLLALLVLTQALAGQDVRKLPDWAQPHAAAAAGETAPADADAWVLLDRTELAYTGNGEMRLRRLRLVKVLTERGREAGTYALSGLGGGASRIKRLKGWNLRPDGELKRLERDNVATLDRNLVDDSALTTEVLTVARLDEVGKGSLVAFESMEALRPPMGPVSALRMLGPDPIRRFELDLAPDSAGGAGCHIDPRHLEPWIPASQRDFGPGHHFRAWNLPARPKGERACPDALNMLPWLLVRFQDPAAAEAIDHTSWDALAQGFFRRYQPFLSAPEVAAGAKDPQAALRAVREWMVRELTYRQVYLTPERGWLPERPEETVRRRYGDCKDLATFLMGQAKALGLQTAPVLVLAGGGEVEPGEEPFYGRFNHLIAAIRLDRSWGLPAEVETPRGRFLLVDATDPFTPFGSLSQWLLDCRVLVCAPDGAAWVTIPPQACAAQGIDLDLRLKADALGTLAGTCDLRETGDAWGLRAQAALQGREALRKLLLRLLPVPADGTLEILETGDPRNLAQPFGIKLRLVHPKGLNRSGEEFELAPWGLPGIPGVIQDGEKPRACPIERDRRGAYHWRAELDLPFRPTPVLPSAQLDTPWRKGAWTAQAGPGNRLVLDYREEGRKGAFGFGTRAEGAAAWKKDRAAIRRIHRDGLALKADS